MRRMKYILTFLVLAFGLTLNAAVFTVTNANDSGPGSLRAAILSANVSPGNDLIDFNIPGTMVHVINVLTQLPPLTDFAGVTIDGLTQVGSTSGIQPPATATLMIELNGFAAGPSHGLIVVSPNNIIQGLIINRFEQDGIRIEGTLSGTYDNLVHCNFLGTDFSGTVDMGNGSTQASPWAGVNILIGPCGEPLTCYNNVVDGNLSSGNYAEGVSISNCPPGDVFNNSVINNYLGTDITGMLDLGNDHDGVYIGEGARDNYVGNNVISGNDYEGVCIMGYVDEFLQIYTHDNTIENNLIGIASDGFSPLGNTRDGVSIGAYGPSWSLGFANENIIVGNTIANNGMNGVKVIEHATNALNGDHNTISMNGIYNNAILGIDLDNNGVSLNDITDSDTQANEELNFPVITSVQLCPDGSANITGTLTIDTDVTMAVVEVFIADLDASGYGEGKSYLALAYPDAAGDWQLFVGGISVTDEITATATDMNGNTSEFGLNATVSPAMTIDADWANVLCAGDSTGAIELSIGSGSSPYSFSWSNGEDTEDIDELTAGIYTVTVTDNAGCADFEQVTITEPDALVLSLVVTDASCMGCDDGAIDLTVSGGTPDYSFDWSNGEITEDITDLFEDIYCVTVTDDNDCEITLCDTVLAPSSISDLEGKLSLVMTRLYPNPFKENVEIQFWLPEAQRIKMSVFNLLGEEVQQLIDEEMIYGEHIIYWNTADSSQIPNGIYLLVIDSKNSSSTYRLVKQK